jgi:hypothetical protein
MLSWSANKVALIIGIDQLINRAMFPEHPSKEKMLNCRDAIEWLKLGIHHAELKLTLAEIDRDIERITFYSEYILLCDIAIDCIRMVEGDCRLEPIKGQYQQLDVQSLKRNVDIVAIAGRYTKLNKVGADFVGVCPFHSEKTPSFHINTKRQTWHCFGACNTGGDVISLIMKAEHLDFKAACNELQRS